MGSRHHAPPPRLPACLPAGAGRMLALRSNKDPKLQDSTSLPSPHFTDAVTAAPRVSWLTQDHVAGWHQPRLPGHLGRCAGPPGGQPAVAELLTARRGTLEMFWRLWSARQGSPRPPPTLPARARTLRVDRPPFPPRVQAGVAAPTRPDPQAPTVCCPKPWSPHSPGAVCIPAGSSCMAPGPHPASGSRPYSLLTVWAGTGALPSRPFGITEGVAPGDPTSGCGPPSHSSTCPSRGFWGNWFCRLRGEGGP